MGEVYRAHDTGKLDRDVALKVLPADVAGDADRLKRFEREAAVVAALNHPNIVTIYTIEEEDGVHFITMELVEGRTLSELIPPGGMQLKNFFDIVIPLTDAISTAHAKGVAHRDLKPANIMVDDAGRVKVLDFGLAKLIESDPDTARTVVEQSNTAEGRVMGTASYMSPEQAEGAAIDHRTDVFSLGIIFYEMVTGERPFTGKSTISTLSSILKDTPPSVTELRRTLPTHLGRIINRCLAKNPDDRVQSVLDLRNDLRGLRDEVQSSDSITAAPAPSATPTASAPAPAEAGKRRRFGLMTMIAAPIVIAALALVSWQLFSAGRDGGGTPDTPRPPASATAGPTKMVVLPFENLGAPDDEYFADGITDEITSRLAVIPGIAVISRTTARKYKDTDKEIKVIGAELGVDYVLEGTIRWDKSGDLERVRITPQLIKVSDDFHVWAQNYERQIDEIFTVQADIATQIAQALDLTLLEGERAAITARPTQNMEAYQLYLRGVAITRSRGGTGEAYEESLHLFERAVALDPQFAGAHAWLSRTHSGMVHFGIDVSPAQLDAARKYADRALALDPTLVDAHVADGYYYYWGLKDYAPALAAAARALEIRPNDVYALELKAFTLRRQGRLEEALEIQLRLHESDPASTAVIGDIADTYTFLRRYDDAVDYCELSLATDATQSQPYYQWAEALRLAGDLAGARVKMNVPNQSTVGQRAIAGLFAQSLQERSATDLLALAERFDEPVLPFQGITLSRGEVRALAYTLLDQPERARAAYTSALAPLDSAQADNPDDARVYMALGRVLAGLGRSDDAIRAGERGFSLYSPSLDALTGQQFATDLAVIYAMSGDAAAALKTLEEILSSPARFSVDTLKLDPRFDGLRKERGYGELLERFGG